MLAEELIRCTQILTPRALSSSMIFWVGCPGIITAS